MEKVFPPSFFTVMVHLVIHLASEAKLVGPVHYRWMYPIERYLSTLKSYVHNRARPEGSIAETYLVDECLTFCSRYLQGAEVRSNRSTRNHANIDPERVQDSCLFPNIGRPYGSIKGFSLDEKIWIQAHRYVLFNCDCSIVESLRREHISIIKKQNRRRRLTQHEIDRLHNENFHVWFKEYIIMAKKKLRKVRVKHSSQNQQNLLQPNSDASSHTVSNYGNQSGDLEREPTETSEQRSTRGPTLLADIWNQS